MDEMLKDLTRARLIQIWFAAVAVAVVFSFVIGADVTASTATLLLALCLVPPGIVWLLWPGAEPPTASEVLHGLDRRM
jgi:hypothetical protein